MNAMDAYTQQAAATASPAQLVLMLYDGALARVTAAQQALTEPVDISAAHTALIKAQAIVHELHVTLDLERGGAVAANLASIYTYVTELLVEVNLSKEPAALTEVADLLAGIRDAWEQACVQHAVAVAG